MVSLAGAVKTPLVIRRISAIETRPLRQAVLRPHQRVEELVYPGDDAVETAHFGAFLDGELIGIASVYHEPPHGEANEGAWRLRGMAVVPQLHRKGIGSLLLCACIDHARQHGGTTMWFNARTPAVPFYQAHDFQVRGEEFMLPDIGPHYFMWSEIGSRCAGHRAPQL
jgi:GNAT superfamily N-acetyltransferase